MLTPKDIEERTFSLAFRGYSRTGVRAFLAEVAEVYEVVLRENDRIKGRLDEARFQLSRFRNLEDTVANTLAVVEASTEEARVTSRDEAQAIMEGAHAEAGLLKQNARALAGECQEEVEGAMRTKVALVRAGLSQASRNLDLLERVKRAVGQDSIDLRRSQGRREESDGPRGY